MKSVSKRIELPLIRSARSVLGQVRAQWGLSGNLPVVIGLSGGMDSTVLSDLLHRHAPLLGLTIALAHLDHGLRPESAQEADAVERFARGIGLPLFREVALPWNGEENVERWARAVRYRFLQEVRERVGAELLLTAHHCDDVGETLLMKLINGRLATSANLLPAFDIQRKLARPLHAVGRTAIERYAHARGLAFVTDRSNLDLSRFRNRVRRELVPLLGRHYNPGIHASAYMVAERLRSDDGYLWGLAERELSAVYDQTARGLSRERLFALPPALQWRVLIRGCVALLGDNTAAAAHAGYGLWVRGREAMATGEPGTVVQVGSGSSLMVDRGGWIRAVTSARHDLAVPADGTILPIPGDLSSIYPDGFKWKLSGREEGPWSSAGIRHDLVSDFSPRCADEVAIPTEFVCSELTVRFIRPGDTVIRPGGLETKVSELFRKRAVWLTLQDRIPIVTSGQKILWIPGVVSVVDPAARSDGRTVRLSYESSI